MRVEKASTTIPNMSVVPMIEGERASRVWPDVPDGVDQHHRLEHADVGRHVQLGVLLTGLVVVDDRQLEAGGTQQKEGDDPGQSIARGQAPVSVDGNDDFDGTDLDPLWVQDCNGSAQPTP